MFVRMPGASGLFVPPELAEMKEKGMWKPFQYLCTHERCSTDAPCQKSDADYICFGDYREPSEYDLRDLRMQAQEKRSAENKVLIHEVEDEICQLNADFL